MCYNIIRGNSMEEKIKELKELIDKSNKIVVFTGAGVSTESGIPDFRSKDGLYNQKYDYPPELILSHDFFINNPEEFYKFYKDKLNSLNTIPNITHKKLKELEDKGKDVTIITQNIDGLHSKAGSSKVLELHGTIMNNYCTKCHKYYDANYVFNSSGIPRCTCGGIIKPDVVLYNEPLPEDVWEKAITAVAKSDLMIVLGTSLRVYPAAYLVDYFHGNLVLINRSSIGHEDKAKLIINDKLSNVFSKI